MVRVRVGMIACLLAGTVAALPALAATTEAQGRDVGFGAPNDILSVGASAGDVRSAPALLLVDAYGRSGVVAATGDGAAMPYIDKSPFDVIAKESLASVEPQSLLPQYDALGRRSTYTLAPDRSLLRQVGNRLHTVDGTASELSYYATEGDGAVTSLSNGFMINIIDTGDGGGGGGTPGHTALFVLAPTPEPATWWTMIAGFGLLGAALRRSRARNTPAQDAHSGG